MTENEPISSARQPSFAWTSAIIIGTAFFTGLVSGIVDGMREDGEIAVSGTLVQLAVTGVGIAILAAYLSRFGRFWTRWSRRKQLYIVSLSLSALMGFVSVIALRIGVGDGSVSDQFGDRTFDARVAVMLSALWIFGMGLSIFIYHRNIDDHEKQAYLWGGLAGFYAIVFPTPAW
ncbi:MAG: hypothetical protein H2056_03980 [Sphingopyxis sp.]|nr:hypothetical protein [Sphingopyxis sp.]